MHGDEPELLCKADLTVLKSRCLEHSNEQRALADNNGPLTCNFLEIKLFLSFEPFFWVEPRVILRAVAPEDGYEGGSGVVARRVARMDPRGGQTVTALTMHSSKGAE
ncbi:hypothetical protein NDU88_000884 [Pleurodeles waltl]|uniref:Uncharacterized protein n=1 Tax=Pleurodeles waltl TaxID=8319 RepID=A0AAV7MI45_PLEWA|nr:hypothetical protein NDU88_000884 [Pleurodeles waltl]